MNTSTQSKLLIMFESSVISEQTYSQTLFVHHNMMKKHGFIQLESYEQALIHLAMALQRIQDSQVVDKMDNDMLDKIKKNDHFNRIHILTKEIENLIEVVIPDSEKHYIWLHFINILNEMRKESCD